MWSGPRNISTALMRAWENREDTIVCDEPLYAHYLLTTQRAHPGAEDIIAHHETEWQRVVERLTAPLPAGTTICYQKHMTHHLLPHIDRSWLDELSHCFLIRDPREVLTSYLKHVTDPTLEDLGWPQQLDIFQRVRSRTGIIPPVLDAKDVLQDPRRLLTALCEQLGIAFSDRMLAWPAGRRDSDGIWARHWYAEVERSTSFRPYARKPDAVPQQFRQLYLECQEYYEQLYEHRLR